MATAGTITVAKEVPLSVACCSTTKDHHQHVHTFLKESGGDGQCFNDTQFVLKSHQQWVLITNLTALSVKLDPENMQAPLQFDMTDPLRLCYNVSIKQPGIALIVGEKTSLTLLLKTGCIEAHPFCLPPSQWIKLIVAQQCPKKRTSAAAAAAAAAAPAAKKIYM
jgi:hypothetical protein